MRSNPNTYKRYEINLSLYRTESKRKCAHWLSTAAMDVYRSRSDVTMTFSFQTHKNSKQHQAGCYKRNDVTGKCK